MKSVYDLTFNHLRKGHVGLPNSFEANGSDDTQAIGEQCDTDHCEYCYQDLLTVS